MSWPEHRPPGCFLTTDLDETVAAGRGKRIEAWYRRARRQDAKEVARLEAADAMPVRRCQSEAFGSAKRRMAVGACTSAP